MVLPTGILVFLILKNPQRFRLAQGLGRQNPEEQTLLARNFWKLRATSRCLNPFTQELNHDGVQDFWAAEPGSGSYEQ